MFEFIIRLKNPWAKPKGIQKDYIEWNKRLSENWAIEFQFSRFSKSGWNNFFELWIDTSWSGEDHAGPRIALELFGYFLCLKVYNINHWDYEKGRFQTKEEALAEYEEPMKEDNEV